MFDRDELIEASLLLQEVLGRSIILAARTMMQRSLLSVPPGWRPAVSSPRSIYQVWPRASSA
jgi:hypothetical protein